MPAWKRWLGWSADARGTVVVDAGAHEAVISGGRSLLAAGIRSLDGDFTAGDVVALAATDGRVFARGLVNYSSADTRRIMGQPSAQIADILGVMPESELMHRDNLIILA
jgi:glutamate 5-kinase